MNERDVVGAQLVRRNDEISLLYEKIRILEVTLHRGKRNTMYGRTVFTCQIATVLVRLPRYPRQEFAMANALSYKTSNISALLT